MEFSIPNNSIDYAARLTAADNSFAAACGGIGPTCRRPLNVAIPARADATAKRPSPLFPLPSPLSSSRGFTLIEMLVVVSIMLILVALGAKMLPRNLDERKVREAARSANVYLSIARNHAMEIGRPCGVIFRCLSSGTTTVPCATTLEQCVVPLPFSGETDQSCARVYFPSANSLPNATFFEGSGTTTLPGNMIRIGDQIQFNSQGPLYTIDNPTNGTVDPKDPYKYLKNVSQVTLTWNGTRFSPWHVFNPPPATTQAMIAALPAVTYRIFRAPMKSAVAPLQLPAGSVVDLGASGVGTASGWNLDVTVLFSPNGSVQAVNGSPVSDRIFLLIGRRDRLEGLGIKYSNTNTNETTLTNWQNLNNFWVTVNPQSGAISTEPMSACSNADRAISITESRSLANESRGTGGR